MFLIKISKILLFIAVGTFIYRRGEILTGGFKPFELIFALSLLFFLGGILYSKENFNKLKNLFNNNIWMGLVLIFVSVIIASIISWFRYGLMPNIIWLLNIGRIAVPVLTFILVAYHSQDQKFWRYLWWLLFIMPLIFAPFIFWPELAYKLQIVDGLPGRLYLLANYPSTAARFLLISLSFSLAALMFKYQSLLMLTASSLTTALLFWAQSRAAWLAILVIMFSNVITGKRKYLIGGLLTILIIAAGFLILDSRIQTSVITRIWSQYSAEEPKISQIAPQKLITEIISKRETPKGLVDQTRLTIWKEYSKIIIKNPFGLGPQAFPYFYVEINGQPKGPHQNILGILVWGGILMLLGFLILGIEIFKNLKAAIQKEATFYNIGIAIALIGLFIDGLIDETFLFHLIWILAALALTYPLGHFRIEEPATSFLKADNGAFKKRRALNGKKP